MDRTTADLLRVLAMAAVVLIHASDAWRAVEAWPQDLRQWSLLVVDQASRFCVPLFVLLSGYALGKRHGADDALPLRDFLARRFARIGVPYLVWSLANVIAKTCFNRGAGGTWEAALRAALAARPDEGVAGAALRALLTGGADYHLYFLPVVLQCYLLFPLLRRWRCTPGSLALVVGAQLALLAWAEAALWTPGLWFPPLWAVFPGWWLGYFVCGMWLARCDAALVARVRALPAALAAALVLLGPALLLADLLAAAAHGVRPEWAGAFYRPAIAAAVAGMLLLGLRADGAIAGAGARARAGGGIASLAAASFATYLAHTWVLRALEPLGIKQRAWWIWLPLALLASAAIGSALHAAARRSRALGWAVGA